MKPTWIVRSLDLFGTPCNTPYESLEAAIADKAAREASGLHHEVILMPAEDAWQQRPIVDVSDQMKNLAIAPDGVDVQKDQQYADISS